MKQSQEFTPKYWVVHDRENDDIFIKSLHKNRDISIDLFLYQHSYELLGRWDTDDDVLIWWAGQNRYVCELVEINLMERI